MADMNGYLVANYLGQTIRAQVFQYAVDSTGAVRAVSSSPAAVASDASFGQVSLFGNTLYILSSSGLDLYTIESQGALSAAGSTLPLPGSLTALAIAVKSGM